MRIIADVTNPDRRGRGNPRHAKRSTNYPARPADPARRPGRRGPLTLIMLPMPIPIPEVPLSRRVRPGSAGHGWRSSAGCRRAAPVIAAR
jgi:hypothetical protein